MGDLVLTHPRVTAYIEDVGVVYGHSGPVTIRWEPSQANLNAPKAVLGHGGPRGSDANCAAIGCGLHAGGAGGGGNDGNSLDGIVPPKPHAPIGYLQIRHIDVGDADLNVILWDGVPGYGVNGGKNGVGGNAGGQGGNGADCSFFCSLDAGIGGDGGNGGNGGNGSDGGLPSDGGYFYIHGRSGANPKVKIVPRGANKSGVGAPAGKGGLGGDGNPAGSAGKPGSSGSDGKPSTATGKPITVIDLTKPSEQEAK